MTHQQPLCQQCIHEHRHFYGQSNAPYHHEQVTRPNGSQVCDLQDIARAINESLQRMQSSLASVQDFIEFKKTIVDFPDEATIQMYLQQNQIFDSAYRKAHQQFFNLQGLPDGQKEMNLAKSNQSFIEEYKRFSQAKGVIEMICQRMQNSRSVPTAVAQNA